MAWDDTWDNGQIYRLFTKRVQAAAILRKRKVTEEDIDDYLIWSDILNSQTSPLLAIKSHNSSCRRENFYCRGQTTKAISESSGDEATGDEAHGTMGSSFLK
jgi:hypothetical protein